MVLIVEDAALADHECIGPHGTHSSGSDHHDAHLTSDEVGNKARPRLCTLHAHTGDRLTNSFTLVYTSPTSSAQCVDRAPDRPSFLVKASRLDLALSPSRAFRNGTEENHLPSSHAGFVSLHHNPSSTPAVALTTSRKTCNNLSHKRLGEAFKARPLVTLHARVDGLTLRPQSQKLHPIPPCL